MILGVKFRCYPTTEQRRTLSQWIGCRRVVWNAKCDEERYHRTFARKFCPIGTFAPIDKTYSHFKDGDLTPWLSEIPAQISKDAACTWAETYQRFMKGECGRPRRKKKGCRESVWLEKALFRFADKKLLVGTKTRPLGEVAFHAHRPWKEPKSITITREGSEWYVSFCYDDGHSEEEVLTQKEHLAYLRTKSEEGLRAMVIGGDRGVAVPLHTGNEAFDFTREQKASFTREERNRQRYQKKMSRQKKGSKRRGKTKHWLQKSHQKTANIRHDFAHKTSFALVKKSGKSVFIFEDLRTKGMTGRPKAKPMKDEKGKVVRYEKNRAAQKAGLNKAILNAGWCKIELFTRYKAVRAGKAWFKIPAAYTSQTCAACTRTSEKSRESQAVFLCVFCGHTDNADANAAKVIAQQAIKLILDSGTELSKRGVLLRAKTKDAEPAIRRRGRKASARAAKPEAAKPRKKRQKRKAA